ncbi:hypothetical protein BO94DRAFT_317750 [Aspergillus sclerotioniger CBS 115572]|uniref:Uncharacterized protein n=1 Tax=Aspergillus sclerotioniger CBS 115572 TaxID=1450535 RepID=A0A317X780_9EURO|nr:hypothetical protein BO94DRAFT_317750 [Aspergillus sclerotioniger CBS 115572]PWY94041.1 hypothetical protein BO94DRAFT_317750 [Aspergillus sclerotioniger CBS 115572]
MVQRLRFSLWEPQFLNARDPAFESRFGPFFVSFTIGSFCFSEGIDRWPASGGCRDYDTNGRERPNGGSLFWG